MKILSSKLIIYSVVCLALDLQTSSLDTWILVLCCYGVSANLQHINSANQHCTAVNTLGKSSLLASWARGLNICWQIGVLHPTNNLS